MEKVDYKKIGISYTFGSFFNKGIAFFAVPIFTRLLTAADYGTVSTYNAWVSMVSVCIGMTLYMAIRQSFVDIPKRIDEFHSTVTSFITIVSGTAFLLCLVFGFVSSVDILLPLLCIIQSYASALIEDYSMYLMMKYKYKCRLIFMIFPNLISVILSIIVVKYFLSTKLYLGRIIPTACVTFFFGMLVLVCVYRKTRNFDVELLKYGLNISLPLIAHGISLTILSQSDRTMITVFVGSDKTGIYSVVYNFSMIATALTSALAGIWSPWFLKKLKSHTKNDMKKINEMSKLYILFMTIIMCEVIFVAPEVMKILASKAYWEGIKIIPPIVLANLVTFIYSFYVDVEHFHRKTILIALNTTAAAVINIVLNYIFIPYFGYEAAAYTTIVSYSVSLIMHFVQARKLEPQMQSLFAYKFEFMFVIVSSVIYYTMIDNWIIRWGLTIVVAIITLIYLWRKYRILNDNTQ